MAGLAEDDPGAGLNLVLEGIGEERDLVPSAIHFEKQNRRGRPLALGVFLFREAQGQHVFSGFQVSAEDDAAWVVQPATESVEKIVHLEITAIDTGLDLAGIGSREDERADRAAFEFEFQFSAGEITP
jgi:hypothetical protein